MTDQTTAELIAEAKSRAQLCDADSREAMRDTGGIILRLAAALEAAEKRAEENRKEVDRLSRELQVAEDQANTIAGDLAQAEQERDEARKAAEDHVLDADAVHVRLSAELREVNRERNRIADALEAAEKRAEAWKRLCGSTETATTEVIEERDQLAATLEKVREAASSQVERSSVLLAVIREITAAPADALRDVKAEAWDKGFEAGWAEKEDPGAFVNDVWDAKTPNPYREGQK